MRWKKTWYLTHRWLGLLVSLQLLAWSIGGFVFSILHIKDVRGEIDVKPHVDPSLQFDGVRLSPGDAVDLASNQGIACGVLSAVTLKGHGRAVVYEIFGNDGKPLALVNAATGDVLLPISESEACRAALDDFAHQTTVTSVALLEGSPPLEYRGGRMPVYRVVLDHPKQPHIYVCPVTGEILKRRNKLWRIFDFFWMLHIMDYGERESFNHSFLTIMSVLAITTSASGLVLWWWRIPRLTGRVHRGTEGASR